MELVSEEEEEGEEEEEDSLCLSVEGVTELETGLDSEGLGLAFFCCCCCGAAEPGAAASGAEDEPFVGL